MEAKLRIIDTKQNTIKIIKQFFKEIVAEPERLPQAGIYLNKLLPSLEDLTTKYIEITSHVAKDENTYLILEKVWQRLIKFVSQLLSNIYSFIVIPIKDLMMIFGWQIEICKKLMRKHYKRCLIRRNKNDRGII